MSVCLSVQEVVCTLNPDAAEATDGTPSKQVPHITSAYLLVLSLPPAPPTPHHHPHPLAVVAP